MAGAGVGQVAGARFHRERECLEHAVLDIGPERSRFGTDWKRPPPATPLDAPYSHHRRQRALVSEARISDAAKELSRGENLVRLLAEARV